MLFYMTTMSMLAIISSFCELSNILIMLNFIYFINFKQALCLVLVCNLVTKSQLIAGFFCQIYLLIFFHTRFLA